MNNLTDPITEHLQEMMTWFNSEAELSEWAGPAFRYPFDQCSFTEDLNLAKLDSFSMLKELQKGMLNQRQELLAFGQCYERVGRWHLGRLAVSPSHRGQGLVQKLIQGLSNFGVAQHGISTNSLFVLEDNKSAIKAYQKCGFVMAQYPEKMPMQKTHYMIRENS